MLPFLFAASLIREANPTVDADNFELSLHSLKTFLPLFSEKSK